MIERLQIPGREPSRLFSAVVRSGDFLFVSGQVSRDESGNVVGAGDFKRQAEQVFANLAAALASAGASLSQIVRMTVYVTDARFRNAFREVTVRYVGDHLPASTLVVVAGLSEPEFLIEIDAIAAAKRDG